MAFLAPRNQPEAPRTSYAARSSERSNGSQKPDRKMVPLYAQERLSFDANGTVHLTPEPRHDRTRCALVTVLHDRHVSERLATRDHSSTVTRSRMSKRWTPTDRWGLP